MSQSVTANNTHVYDIYNLFRSMSEPEALSQIIIGSSIAC